MLARSLRNALIALAVVVGAYVEDGMILAVVPFYQLVVLAYEREEATATGTRLLLVALLYLCQQPTALDVALISLDMTLSRYDSTGNSLIAHTQSESTTRRSVPRKVCVS